MFGAAQSAAMPQASGGALGHAAGWFADMLGGSAGTVIAILGIAAVGFAMLQGRLAVRDGARAVLGCFILFGAPVIAQGLSAIAAHSAAAPAKIHDAPPPPQMTIPKPPAANRDPYAGASVPM